MWVLKAWSFSVRSILRPSESLGDSPQSWWWVFCASVNPGRVSSASTRVPRFAFCDVAQICKCVCLMVLCWKLYLDFEKTKFSSCVWVVCCVRVCFVLFFFFFIGLKLLLFELENLRVVCVLCLLQQKEAEEEGVGVWVWRVGVGMLEF
jgi:hypothetical protein